MFMANTNTIGVYDNDMLKFFFDFLSKDNGCKYIGDIIIVWIMNFATIILFASPSNVNVLYDALPVYSTYP